jgi:nucleotide-binding universal stress UspA family protein
MKNILTPIDFSDITKEVIEQAANVARTFSAKLWLIHVASPEPDSLYYETGSQLVRDQVAEKYHNEHIQLQNLAKEIKDGGIDVTALLVQGYTIDKILKEASNIKADLIILGSHGHGALYTTLMGSVTKGVLQDASCPLFIIPAKK